MNAVTQTPILDRVRDFMRDAAGARSLTEVVLAFPGETAAVVRLSLGALRKQQILDGWIEGTIPFYIWRGDGKSHRPAVPVAGFQPHRPAVAAAPGARDLVLQAMKDGKQPRYTIGELATVTGFSRETTNRLLNELAGKGDVFAHGRTSGRFYTLTDIPDPRPRIVRVLVESIPPATPAAANEPEQFVLGGSAEVELRTATRVASEPSREAPSAPSTEEELRRLGVPEELISGKPQRHQPNFGYFNDGSLYVDTRYCQGYLERADLAALRAFLNEMFLPTEKSA